MRHCGKVKISSTALLNHLQFPNGKIRNCVFDPEFDIIELLIEDDEMPEVKNGECVQTIMLTYTTYQNCNGEKVSIRNKVE